MAKERLPIRNHTVHIIISNQRFIFLHLFVEKNNNLRYTNMAYRILNIPFM